MSDITVNNSTMNIKYLVFNISTNLKINGKQSDTLNKMLTSKLNFLIGKKIRF